MTIGTIAFGVWLAIAIRMFCRLPGKEREL